MITIADGGGARARKKEQATKKKKQYNTLRNENSLSKININKRKQKIQTNRIDSQIAHIKAKPIDSIQFEFIIRNNFICFTKRFNLDMEIK